MKKTLLSVGAGLAILTLAGCANGVAEPINGIYQRGGCCYTIQTVYPSYYYPWHHQVWSFRHRDDCGYCVPGHWVYY